MGRASSTWLTAVLVLVLVLVLVPAPALAAGSFSRAFPGHGSVFARPGDARAAPGRSAPPGARHHSLERLQRFSAERRLEARVRLREQSRDVERDARERQLARVGRTSDVAAYRQRETAREESDELAIETELDAFERRGLRPLGPVTRRVLFASGIRLRRSGRMLELVERIRALERAARDASPPARPLLDAPPP